MSVADQVCEVNTLTGEILFNGNITVLRPKTFQLFLLLASEPETIFSKAEILASVWQGTVVEDQVIFQSINEIRKELGHSEVIKTYPRRGYCIGVPTSVTTSANNEKHKNSSQSHTKSSRNSIVAVLIFLLVMGSLVFTYLVSSTKTSSTNASSSKNKQPPEDHALIHNGILVLPFKVSALTESQHWLRYGAMEGLIKKIKPNNRMTIFHLEDVIEILNRIPEGKRNNINNIFVRSGASYILETSVSGTPGELIFVYTIYSRTNRVTNTISAKNHEIGLSKMVTSLEQRLDEHLTYDAAAFDKQLQNDLISKAVQFLEINDYNSALTFIKGALINDPNNITALYFLVKSQLILGQAEESLAANNKALALIENSENEEYKPRLLYFKGVALMNMGRATLAEQNLLSAYALARDKKDWLYYAYAQSMLGELNLQQQRFEQAYALFNSALEYQELLNCPYGVVQGHVDLANFYIKKGEKEHAEQRTAKARTLINEGNLTQALPLLNVLEDGLSRL